MPGASFLGALTRSDPVDVDPLRVALVTLLATVLVAGSATGQSYSVESTAKGELGMSWGVEGPFERPPAGENSDALDPRIRPTILGVTPCSPAHEAGLQPGDVLARVNGRDVREGPPFPESEPGTGYHIEFLRDGRPRETTLVVGPPRSDPPEPVSEGALPSPSEWGCGSGS